MRAGPAATDLPSRSGARLAKSDRAANKAKQSSRCTVDCATARTLRSVLPYPALWKCALLPFRRAPVGKAVQPVAIQIRNYSERGPCGDFFRVRHLPMRPGQSHARAALLDHSAELRDALGELLEDEEVSVALAEDTLEQAARVWSREHDY